VSVQVLEISHSKMRLVIIERVIEVIMFGYLKEESRPFTFHLSFEFPREIKKVGIFYLIEQLTYFLLMS
jgi:hypothetical protein